MDISQIACSGPASRDWVEILSALLVPTIALLGALIALLQWQINRARLKNELFDRRYEQFLAIRDFLGSIMASGKSTLDQQRLFLSRTRGLRFVFDKDIADYVDKNVWEPALRLECLEAELDGLSPGDERTKNCREQAAIKSRLAKELRELDDQFDNFLQLKH